GQHDRSRFGGGGFFAWSAGVAGGLLDPQLVAHVACQRFVALFGGARDVAAAFTQVVALQPLVGVAGGVVRPGAVFLSQRFFLLGGAGDFRRRRGERDGWQHDRGRFRGGGFFAWSAGVARGLLHPQLVPHVSGDRFVALFGGARDVGAPFAQVVALQP